MKQETSEKNEIKPTGSFFKVDENGFLINPTSLEKIQKEWMPVIDDVINVYKKTYGEDLKQVYVRGSVAKGEAVPGISDLDTYAFVDLKTEALKNKYVDSQTIIDLEKKYNFVKEIEMMAIPISKISENYIVLNQSVCVYGRPLKVPKMKPGKSMAIHALGFHNRIVWFERFMARENDTPAEVKKSCTWIMKGLLRTGFELTMERSKKYTRDLYKCYETFAEYHPDRKSEMREVLELAINPTADKQKIKVVMNNLGQWMSQEIPKHYELKM